MAEYINRDLIEWYGCNFEDADCENRECSGCSHAECSHSQVMQIPPADVIEREKINKAIAEIEGEYSTCNQDWIDGLNRALDILKRNIGE